MKLVYVTFLCLVASVVIAELSIDLGINNYEFGVSGRKKASETICTFSSLSFPRPRDWNTQSSSEEETDTKNSSSKFSYGYGGPALRRRSNRGRNCRCEFLSGVGRGNSGGTVSCGFFSFRQ